VSVTRQDKHFFFAKKKQKTFVRWAGRWPQTRAIRDESFLVLFFKKEPLLT
jgi:hypothetical protein